MNHTFTDEQLLLFIYNELEEPLLMKISQDLISNRNLAERLDDLRTWIACLDNFQVNPNETSLKIILEESLTSGLLAEY